MNELEEARDFLRRRLDSERSMKKAVEDLLILYGVDFIRALFKGNVGDIDLRIDALCAELIADCEILALDEDRDDWKDAILAYLHGERVGKTLNERVRERCVTFYNEALACYSAGRLLGLDEYEVISSFVGNMKHPWESDLLNTVRDKIEDGEIAGDLKDFEEPHYGSGKEISSMGALQTMTAFAVADAWMKWGYDNAKDKGATGYYIDRGSSYDCEECDSHVGVLYKMDDEANRPQYHLNCCCVIIYSYVDRLK